MYNDFVIIGDRADPAGVADSDSVVEAFKRIHASGSLFISRGDDSGTHKKEKSIWQAADLAIDEPWSDYLGRVSQPLLLLRAPDCQ